MEKDEVVENVSKEEQMTTPKKPVETKEENSKSDFETMLKSNKAFQSEFDRRVNQALETAKGNGYVYTKNQIKWLKLARKPIKNIKRIDPCLILTGASYNENGEVGVSPKISYESKMTVEKIFTTIAFMTIITLVAIQLAGKQSLSV